MSRTYGTVPTPTSPSSSSTLNPTKTDEDDGIASVKSSVVNLTNTVIGTGALAFPSAFAAMGLIPGIVSCIFSGGATMFGLYLLSLCATHVGKRPGDEGRKASFNEVTRLTFGKGWATKLFDSAIAIKCFGVSCSYLIICKTLLPQVCNTISHALNRQLPEHSILLSQDFWLVVVMLIIVPLSFLKTLDSLRFASQVALATVVYLIAVVVGWFIVKGVSPTRGEVRLARYGNNTLSSFPVQVFAYTCAQNIFPIYNELKNKTQTRMNQVIGISIGSACAVYEVLGIIGYLTFGSKVGSNIIAMYPATSLIIAVGRLGIVLLVGLSYPLQLLPCRQCVHLLTTGIGKKSQEATVGVSGDEEENEDEEGPLVPKNGDHGHASVDDMGQAKFFAITLGILGLGFIIAATVDELEVVLGFVGSTGSAAISYILPGLFALKLFKSSPIRWWGLALAVYGFAVMGFCLTFNIIHVIRHEGPSGH